nr:S8 family serine peptidase [Wenzhouxiangella limi]
MVIAILGTVPAVLAAEVVGVPGPAKNPATALGEQRYIVRFVEAPVASYRGGVPGLRATAPPPGTGQRLDVDSDAARAYRNWLARQQQAHLDALSNRVRRTIRPERAHQWAINAVTVRLNPAEAAELARFEQVAHIERDRALPLTTDYGPEWIGADQLWEGISAATAGERGEGIVVGILDTGINFGHPSFAATTEDGYTHTNPLGSGNYLGWCDPENLNYDASYACNDKLIGAWDFADAAWEEESDGPEDNQGHGSHVAATVAGNPLSSATVQAPTVSLSSAISGVAPQANLIAYDVCAELCRTSDVVAALDQAIKDGVDVVNESIGIGGDIFRGAKQQAYLGVLDAGIMAVRAAGNSGPGARSVDTEPVWTASVAAASHPRAYINRLVDFSGGDDALGDITGASLTSGYGPAPIVDAADAGDAQCLDAFPAETWNGEIVICTRGEIGRVQKGDNVAAGGAGGLILVDDGSGLVADAHVLPAVHITAEDGQALRQWLATGSNHQGAIAGTTITADADTADVLAGFSSRGPLNVDVIKPDMTAPGVAILAAVAADGGNPETYGVYSGTSMASPHVAGAAALLRAIHPTWTPSEIRSALMGTALPDAVRTETLAEANPFDGGSGRIDVERAARSGLLMNESVVDFAAADPTTGGDPRTLNLPSLQDAACGRQCSWRRSVRSALGQSVDWSVSYQGDGEVAISPSSFTLGPGQERSLQIDADLSRVDQDAWQFGRLAFENQAEGVPGFTMPLAAFSASADTALEFEQTVDRAAARPGDELVYGFRIAPFFSGDYRLSDPLPEGVTLDETSLSAGMSFDAVSRTVRWSGSMDGGALVLGSTDNPPVSTYQSLADFGVDAFPVPDNMCDEGGVLINGLDFRFQGRAYSELIWSVNGALEPGRESLSAVSANNQSLPNPQLPALIAPMWTDMIVCDSGALRVAIVPLDSNEFYVFEWDQVPLFDPLANAEPLSFQVWIEKGGENFWFVYGNVILGDWDEMTVGAQFAGGSLGELLYFNGAGTLPASGDVLGGGSSVDSQNLEFSVQTDADRTGLIINEALLEDESGRSDSLRTWTQVELPLFYDRFEQP